MKKELKKNNVCEVNSNNKSVGFYAIYANFVHSNDRKRNC